MPRIIKIASVPVTSAGVMAEIQRIADIAWGSPDAEYQWAIGKEQALQERLRQPGPKTILLVVFVDAGHSTVWVSWSDRQDVPNWIRFATKADPMTQIRYNLIVTD
jgi:hypothetical protein